MSTKVTKDLRELGAAEKWVKSLTGRRVLTLRLPESEMVKLAVMDKSGRGVTDTSPKFSATIAASVQSAVAKRRLPSPKNVSEAIETAVAKIMYYRLSTGGGDIKGRWRPLTQAYLKQKMLRYPGRGIGQASGALLRAVRAMGVMTSKKR